MDLIGKKGYIHTEKVDGVWFMVDAEGAKFAPTGMNHIGEFYRFASYNKDHWVKEFGPGIFGAGGQVNWKGPETKKWMERVVKDHRDYSFNTIAYHHPGWMPDEYYEQLKIYYYGKLHLGHAKEYRARQWGEGGKFPDVFSDEWKAKSEQMVKNVTYLHKNNKYLMGYTFDDLPDYSIREKMMVQKVIKKNYKGFIHHPWVIDIISAPGMTGGKKAWMGVLQKQYGSPQEAGAMYGVTLNKWEDVASVTEWGIPKSVEQGYADQAEMNKIIVEVWLKTHHDLLRKYDPNHLIFGDKLDLGWGHPDWVWELVGKYTDITFIQHFDYFSPKHEKNLERIHQLTSQPLMNGDHAYGFLRPNMKKTKGQPVDSLEEVGKEYIVYMKGIMNLPFMLGWQYCGYLETWQGRADATGSEQCGFFDPFGKPIEEVLVHVKQANEQAVSWHEQAGKRPQEYSRYKNPWEK